MYVHSNDGNIGPLKSLRMSEKIVLKSKQELRQRVLTLLRNQKEEARLKKSFNVQEKLFNLPEFKKSRIILFYLSFDGEVNTLEMIKQAINLGKKIGLPKIIKKLKGIVPFLVDSLDRGLTDGPYGVKEPIDKGTNRLALEEIDLVVVPGIAFDRSNQRLGRGGGFYDRFLKKLPAAIPTIGLAYDFQLFETLPHQTEHDMKLSRVLVSST